MIAAAGRAALASLASLAVAAALAPSPARAEGSRLLELGYQGASRFEDGVATRVLPYVQYRQSEQLLADPATWDFDGGLRLGMDFSFNNVRDPRPELSVRAGSVAYSRGNLKETVGFQEIPWGETFGFQIADLVNPRDWRDPLLLDPAWVRLPVFAFNTQLFLDRLTLQGIWTPIPRQNQLPEANTAFDPTFGVPASTRPILREATPFAVSSLGADSEFGGRASYLFESGVDWGVFYFWHWNRIPTYELRPDRDQPATRLELIPVTDERIHSLGTTLSYSSGGWVGRVDSVLNLGQPLQNAGLGQVERDGALWQSILGADWTPEGGDWTLGGQYHSEVDYYRSTTLALNWLSARLMGKLAGGKLEPEVFTFVGLDTRDLWIQPRLGWNLSSIWTASLRVDYVKGGPLPEAGYLGTFRNQSRALVWVTCKLN